MIKFASILPLTLAAAPAFAAGQFRPLPIVPAALPSVRITVPVTLPKIAPVLPLRLPGIVPAARPGQILPAPDTRLPFVPTAIVAIVNAPTAANLSFAFDNAKKPEAPAPEPVVVPAPAKVPAQSPQDLVKGNTRISFPERDLLDDIGIE